VIKAINDEDRTLPSRPKSVAEFLELPLQPIDEHIDVIINRRGPTTISLSLECQYKIM